MACPKIDIALVIASPWIDIILAAHKTWELRSRNCRSGRSAW